MTSSLRKFHLGAILSVTTGILMPPPTGYEYPVECLYDILDYMTNDSNSTLALGRAADECKPYLFEQLPFTREIVFKDGEINEANFEEKLAQLVEQYGEFHPVRPIHGEDHEHLSDIEDLLRLRPDFDVNNIATFDLGDLEDEDGD